MVRYTFPGTAYTSYAPKQLSVLLDHSSFVDAAYRAVTAPSANPDNHLTDELLNFEQCFTPAALLHTAICSLNSRHITS